MPHAISDNTYDVIIAGAGASGCVLASRLSDIPDKRVLLIEAGPDALPGREHADIRNPFPISMGNPRFFWPGLTAEVGAEPADGRSRTSTPFLQGFGVGGGSNVNGMFADRGLPKDYDEWRDLGASGWGWSDVLPYFRKLENDRDFVGPLHGKEGPIPIRRLEPEHWAPFIRALAGAFKNRGAQTLDDSNGEPCDGVSSVPMNCLPDQRVSASMAYLTEQVRLRPNLTVLADTKVEKLQVRNRLVRGVDVRTSAGARTIIAPEVIVACGAVHSPALLLRSGIGPGEQLRSLNIQIVQDLQGVGRNLQNHPYVMLAVHLRFAGLQPVRQYRWLQNLLRYSSTVADCAKHDMLLLPSSKSAWHPLGRHIATLGILVQKSYSQGSVDLTSSNPAVPPRVRFNTLDDLRDLERLVEGLQIASEVLADEGVMSVRNEVFVPNEAIGCRLAKRSTLNWLQSWLISKAMRIAPLRRAVLGKSTIDVNVMAKDEEARRNCVREHSKASYHLCGTCKMGTSDDPKAVVDTNGRVLGIEGLRVIDASVFPTVPSACTHLPVLMVAEKMADHIKAEWLTLRSGDTRAA